jgi:hypothetical protein
VKRRRGAARTRDAEEGELVDDKGPGVAVPGGTVGARVQGGVWYREVESGPGQGEKTCYRVGPSQLDYYFFDFFQSGLSLFCFKSGILKLQKM